MASKPEEPVSFSDIVENSTPVGMLFDHGADAITAVLFGLQIIVLFGIKN